MNSAGANWHWVSCLRKGPSWRTEADIDIIFSKLKTMKVFEHYPEDVLREISRDVRHDTFLANETLFSPGEEARYWYAVVSGTVKMFNVDPDDSAKTTLICALSGGDSFGEDVLTPGTTRQTLVMTADYCELLYVEALRIRRIYEAHKDAMKDLLTPRSLSIDQDSVDSDGAETERDSITPDSDLAMAGLTLIMLIKDHFANDLISDHRVNLHTYKNCCSGRRLVEWTLNQSTSYRTRPQVIQMWQALLSEGILKHVTNSHPFRDDDQLLYQFVNRPLVPSSSSRRARRWSTLIEGVATDDKLPNGRPRSSCSVASSPRSSRSSLTSILDECFDTIAALGPEVLIYASLRKDPAERSEEDIELIYDELIHIGPFRHLSNAVKRELSACARLEHYKKTGKYVFREGDKGDSWYVILRGSVNVLIQGKGVVCSLHEGQEFGKLAVVNEAVRSASVQVKEDNTYFLSVLRSDFKRILLSVESTNIRFEEHGKEVLLLEKARQGRYLVVKGRPDRMLDHLLESEIEIGSQEDTFAQDFFLTYPAFISISELCEGLRKRYNGVVIKSSGDTPASSSTEQVKVRKRRVVDAVCIWIRTAKAELVKDMTFLKLLHELQDLIAEDGLANHLTSTLADSIKESAGRSGGLAGSPLLPLKSRKTSAIEHEIKMGITTVPPMQPQDKIPLRIHTVDHTCCRLQVRIDSTARAIVNEACTKLDLDPKTFNLCEVKSSGEKNQLDDNDISVYSEISVNGRLYIVPKSHAEKTLPPLPDQNQKPVAPFPEKDGAKELAAHLTVYDWNLFSNIQQMEYIYHLFGRHKFNRITTNLDLIIKRFNEVQFWVMTEVCREQELIKRVALIKKFIKMAGYCKSFNNMNSFLAIVIGLMSGPVTRLRQSWKELPPRLKTRFDQFQALTDPSRNHKVLRAFQAKLVPPVIPFMPLVTKDAYFLHIGNETFVGGLVNFEKMRLVASNVRGLGTFRSASLASEVRMLANKNPATQQYIRTLRVIDNVAILTEMSHKVEPSLPSRPQSTAT